MPNLTNEVTALRSEVATIAEYLGLTEDYEDTRCGCRPLYQRNSAECVHCASFSECNERATAIARLTQVRRQLEAIEQMKGGD